MREFLARKQVAHSLIDVRKAPIAPKDALAIVRQHARAVATRGGKVQEVDPRTADDETLLKLFLGREGFLRAPTVSDGKTIVGGFVEAELSAMIR